MTAAEIQSAENYIAQNRYLAAEVLRLRGNTPAAATGTGPVLSLRDMVRDATEAQRVGETADAIEDAVTSVLPISGDNQNSAAERAAAAVAAAPMIVAALKAPPAALDATRFPVYMIVEDTPPTEATAGGTNPAGAAAGNGEQGWIADVSMSNT